MKNLILLLLLLFSFRGYSQKYEAEIGVNEKVYVIVEEMPLFPNGKEGLVNYLRKNIQYPKKAIEKGNEGKVIVSFVVNKKGETTGIKVTQSVSEELDNEAIRLIKNMPRWIPGKQDGFPVSVSFNLPLNFTLPKQ